VVVLTVQCSLMLLDSVGPCLFVLTCLQLIYCIASKTNPSACIAEAVLSAYEAAMLLTDCPQAKVNNPLKVRSSITDLLELFGCCVTLLSFDYPVRRLSVDYSFLIELWIHLGEVMAVQEWGLRNRVPILLRSGADWAVGATYLQSVDIV
jgi:hypothetical protein